MLCQRCHKKLASVRYAEVVDGQVTQQHLCPDCASELQADSASGFELGGAVPTEQRSAVDLVMEAMRSQRTCPVCGTQLRQALQVGRVGCADCYKTFEKHLQAHLGAIHPALRHCGKSTRPDSTQTRLKDDLLVKRSLLRRVVQAEDYEEAARLRDEIHALEEGLHAPSSGTD